MIKIVLLTLFMGGGYVEEVSEYRGTWDQCVKDAQKHSKYSYCVQFVDKKSP